MNEYGFQTKTKYGNLNISSQDEYGFRPYQLMISSIVGCSGGMLRNILEKMRIPFDDITISAQVTRNPDKANRIEAIELTYTLVGEDIPYKKAEKALALSRNNCAMIQSVAGSIEITEKLQVKK